MDKKNEAEQQILSEKSNPTQRKEKDKEEFEKFVNSELQRLQQVLLLDSFKLDPVEQKQETSFFECNYHYPYKTILIFYGEHALQYWRNGNRKYLITALTHEMIHPITDPMYTIAKDRYATAPQIENERERLTDEIANIILKLMYP